ncbi:hypothetical protein [Pantoea sp. AS-PWVM4]|uniref:hypothetical protein n=1 Tax=Pantoea sp. AS-PWVM4 TaxID=1332069 RepID=UPI00190F3BDF|nr:hypothetical protein [Pantoea sp. AS-PWVM4]
MRQENVMEIDDAQCRVTQAQAVLSMWLESCIGKDDRQGEMIGAVMSLLEGISESMEK